MTTQPTLFGHADTSTTQGRLFADGPRESGLSCQCGRPLVRTASGYWSCPAGHGRLSEDVGERGDDDAGRLFD